MVYLVNFTCANTCAEKNLDVNKSIAILCVI